MVVDPPKNPAKRDLFYRLHDSIVSLAGEAATRASGQEEPLLLPVAVADRDSLQERMRGRSIDVFVHHSSVSLEERRCRRGGSHTGPTPASSARRPWSWVSTSGTWIIVFQANAPTSVSSFMQRMGRTRTTCRHNREHDLPLRGPRGSPASRCADRAGSRGMGGAGCPPRPMLARARSPAPCPNPPVRRHQRRALLGAVLPRSPTFGSISREPNSMWRSNI